MGCPVSELFAPLSCPTSSPDGGMEEASCPWPQGGLVQALEWGAVLSGEHMTRLQSILAMERLGWKLGCAQSRWHFGEWCVPGAVDREVQGLHAASVSLL